MTMRTRIRALLVDPSLYTAPYDAALSEGLLAAGVEPLWAIRPVRRNEDEEIPGTLAAPIFYKWIDDTPLVRGRLRTFLKGCAHVIGLLRLLLLITRRKPDLVHVQWVVLPPIDLPVLWLIKLMRPLVVTVHDPTPYNGERMSLFKRAAFDAPIRLADQVIVHTHSGRQTLIARGLDARKIHVIPHGPLQLKCKPRQRLRRDWRWTFVLFGEIKPYKGLDILVEALALLPVHLRCQARVIVAGRPRMALDEIIARIEALGLRSIVELIPRRLSHQEVADLLAEADCFVFPYREIDASGVYFLTKPLGKWAIASRVGIFAEDLTDGVDGALIPCGDPQALAGALKHALIARPLPIARSVTDSWREIGQATRALYERALARGRVPTTLVDEGRADA